METKGKEAVIGLILGTAAVVAVGAIALAAGKDEDGNGGAVEITVYDKYGIPVPHNSPMELIEGDPYTIAATVTNRSTKKGIPWSANLKTILMVNGAVPEGLVYLVNIEDVYEYAPDETRVITSQTFTVPLGFGGYSGDAAGYLIDPNNVTIASVIEAIDYILVPIIIDVDIILDILDINSLVVSGSPAKVDEGETYFVRVAVQNNSSKSGVLWPQKLTTWITVFYNGNQVKREGWVADYAGGELVLHPLTDFLMPIGTGAPEPVGNPGSVLIEVKDFATSALLDSLVKELAIIEVPVDYGGDIILT